MMPGSKQMFKSKYSFLRYYLFISDRKSRHVEVGRGEAEREGARCGIMT